MVQHDARMSTVPLALFWSARAATLSATPHSIPQAVNQDVSAVVLVVNQPDAGACRCRMSDGRPPFTTNRPALAVRKGVELR